MWWIRYQNAIKNYVVFIQTLNSFLSSNITGASSFPPNSSITLSIVLCEAMFKALQVGHAEIVRLCNIQIEIANEIAQKLVNSINSLKK